LARLPLFIAYVCRIDFNLKRISKQQTLADADIQIQIQRYNLLSDRIDLLPVDGCHLPHVAGNKYEFAECQVQALALPAVGSPTGDM